MRPFDPCALFFIGYLLVASPAADASFLQPKSCQNLTQAELLAAADIAGYGTVTRSGCRCTVPLAWSYHCETTVTLTDLQKGSARNITYQEQLPVDAPYMDECLRYQKEMSGKTGTGRMYYFKKNGQDFEEVPAQACQFH